MVTAGLALFGLPGCDGGDRASSPDAAAERTPPRDIPPPREVPETAVESRVDPEALAELTEILGRPDPFERARLLGERLAKWGPERAVTAEALLEDPKLNLDATAFDLLMRVWATYQPAEASRWAVTQAPTIFRGAAVLEAFTLWATEDPAAAATAMGPWSKAYTDMSDVLRTGLVRGWYASGDVEGLETYMVTQGAGLGRQRILSQYIRTRIQAEGAEATIEWAETFPETDEAMKQSIYRQMASNLPFFDFDAAMSFYERHRDGPYGKDLRNIIARRWVRTDGGKALAWLATDYPGVGVDRELDLGLRVAFSRWTNQDRESALAWAAVQTENDELLPWMMPMLPVYVRMLAADDPERAVRLAARIEDPVDREIVLTDVVRVWLDDDPEAAELWLASSPLSEEAREKARGPNKRRPAGDS